jgi:tripartite-type tricarboxylate transporter receptor subunit TctC
MREEGLDDVDTSIWYAFFAPKNTPLAIRKKLADAIVQVNQIPAVKEALTKSGAEPLSVTLDALESYVEKDIQRWKAVTENVKTRMK